MTSKQTEAHSYDEPIKKSEKILSSDEAPFQAKIEALIELWKMLSECGLSPKLQYVINLMDWAKLHTLNIVLSGEWKEHNDQYESRLLYEVDHCEKELFKLNNSFSLHCKKLLKVIKNPWDNSILVRLLNTPDAKVDKEDIDFFLGESGYLVSMRLKKLCESHCEDLALNLVTAYMKCCEMAEDETIRMNLTEDQKRFMLDVHIALLFKYKQTNVILDILKRMNLQEGLDLVRRFAKKRVSISKIWRNSHGITHLAAVLFCSNAILKPYEDSSEILIGIMDAWLSINEKEETLATVTGAIRKLFTVTISAPYMYLFCEALIKKYGARVKSFYIEHFLHALTSDLNLLERHKNDSEERHVYETAARLANSFLNLADALNDQINVSRECVLTAFSIRPTKDCLTKIENIARQCGYKVLDTGQWRCKLHPPYSEDDEVATRCMTCGEFMAHMQLRDALNTNTALSEALSSSKLELSREICDDLIVVVCSPRYQLLSWVQNWKDLHRLCVMYLDSPEKTKNFTTELKFLDIDYDKYKVKQELAAEEDAAEEEAAKEQASIEAARVQISEYTPNCDEPKPKKKRGRKRKIVNPLPIDDVKDVSYMPYIARTSNPLVLQTLRSYRPSFKRKGTNSSTSTNVSGLSNDSSDDCNIERLPALPPPCTFHLPAVPIKRGNMTVSNSAFDEYQTSVQRDLFREEPVTAENLCLTDNDPNASCSIQQNLNAYNAGSAQPYPQSSKHVGNDFLMTDFANEITICDYNKHTQGDSILKNLILAANTDNTEASKELQIRTSFQVETMSSDNVDTKEHKSINNQQEENPIPTPPTAPVADYSIGDETQNLFREKTLEEIFTKENGRVAKKTAHKEKKSESICNKENSHCLTKKRSKDQKMDEKSSRDTPKKLKLSPKPSAFAKRRSEISTKSIVDVALAPNVTDAISEESLPNYQQPTETNVNGFRQESDIIHKHVTLRKEKVIEVKSLRVMLKRVNVKSSPEQKSDTEEETQTQVLGRRLRPNKDVDKNVQPTRRNLSKDLKVVIESGDIVDSNIVTEYVENETQRFLGSFLVPCVFASKDNEENKNDDVENNIGEENKFVQISDTESDGTNEFPQDTADRNKNPIIADVRKDPDQNRNLKNDKPDYGKIKKEEAKKQPVKKENAKKDVKSTTTFSIPDFAKFRPIELPNPKITMPRRRRSIQVLVPTPTFPDPRNSSVIKRVIQSEHVHLVTNSMSSFVLCPQKSKRMEHVSNITELSVSKRITSGRETSYVDAVSPKTIQPRESKRNRRKTICCDSPPLMTNEPPVSKRITSRRKTTCVKTPGPKTTKPPVPKKITPRRKTICVDEASSLNNTDQPVSKKITGRRTTIGVKAASRDSRTSTWMPKYSPPMTRQRTSTIGAFSSICTSVNSQDERSRLKDCDSRVEIITPVDGSNIHTAQKATEPVKMALPSIENTRTSKSPVHRVRALAISKRRKSKMIWLPESEISNILRSHEESDQEECTIKFFKDSSREDCKSVKNEKPLMPRFRSLSAPVRRNSKMVWLPVHEMSNVSNKEKYTLDIVESETQGSEIPTMQTPHELYTPETLSSVSLDQVNRKERAEILTPDCKVTADSQYKNLKGKKSSTAPMKEPEVSKSTTKTKLTSVCDQLKRPTHITGDENPDPFICSSGSSIDVIQPLKVQRSKEIDMVFPKDALNEISDHMKITDVNLYKDPSKPDHKRKKRSERSISRLIERTTKLFAALSIDKTKKTSKASTLASRASSLAFNLIKRAKLLASSVDRKKRRYKTSISSLIDKTKLASSADKKMRFKTPTYRLIEKANLTSSVDEKKGSTILTSTSSQKSPETSASSQKIPEMSVSSQKIPEMSVSSQKIPEMSVSSQKIPETSLSIQSSMKDTSRVLRSVSNPSNGEIIKVYIDLTVEEAKTEPSMGSPDNDHSYSKLTHSGVNNPKSDVIDLTVEKAHIRKEQTEPTMDSPENKQDTSTPNTLEKESEIKLSADSGNKLESSVSVIQNSSEKNDKMETEKCKVLKFNYHSDSKLVHSGANNPKSGVTPPKESIDLTADEADIRKEQTESIMDSPENKQDTSTPNTLEKESDIKLITDSANDLESPVSNIQNSSEQNAKMETEICKTLKSNYRQDSKPFRRRVNNPKYEVIDLTVEETDIRKQQSEPTIDNPDIKLSADSANKLESSVSVIQNSSEKNAKMETEKCKVLQSNFHPDSKLVHSGVNNAKSGVTPLKESIDLTAGEADIRKEQTEPTMDSPDIKLSADSANKLESSVSVIQNSSEKNAKMETEKCKVLQSNFHPDSKLVHSGANNPKSGVTLKESIDLTADEADIRKEQTKPIMDSPDNKQHTSTPDALEKESEIKLSADSANKLESPVSDIQNSSEKNAKMETEKFKVLKSNVQRRVNNPKSVVIDLTVEESHIRREETEPTMVSPDNKLHTSTPNALEKESEIKDVEHTEDDDISALNCRIPVKTRSMLASAADPLMRPTHITGHDSPHPSVCSSGSSINVIQQIEVEIYKTVAPFNDISYYMNKQDNSTLNILEGESEIKFSADSANKLESPVSVIQNSSEKNKMEIEECTFLKFNDQPRFKLILSEMANPNPKSSVTYPKERCEVASVIIRPIKNSELSPSLECTSEGTSELTPLIDLEISTPSIIITPLKQFENETVAYRPTIIKPTYRECLSSTSSKFKLRRKPSTSVFTVTPTKHFENESVVYKSEIIKPMCREYLSSICGKFKLKKKEATPINSSNVYTPRDSEVLTNSPVKDSENSSSFERKVPIYYEYFSPTSGKLVVKVKESTPTSSHTSISSSSSILAPRYSRLLGLASSESSDHTSLNDVEEAPTILSNPVLPSDYEENMSELASIAPTETQSFHSLEAKVPMSKVGAIKPGIALTNQFKIQQNSESKNVPPKASRMTSSEKSKGTLNNSSEAKTVLANVPGLNDTALIQPAPQDSIIQVVQTPNGRTNSTVNSTNSQTSTQISPHIQRIGQPRNKPETSTENSTAVSTIKTSTANAKPPSTQPSTLINFLSQQITRPAHQRPLINILSQQILRPAYTTAPTTAVKTTTTTAVSSIDEQSNISSRMISGEQQIINQIVSPVRNAGTPIKLGSSSESPSRIVQFICQSSDGKLIPVTSFTPNRVVKVATTQTATPISPSSPNYDENFTKFIQTTPKIAKTEQNASENSAETLPKFQQAFGKSVYQNNVDNASTNNVKDKAKVIQQKPTTTTAVNVKPIQAGVIYTRQIPSGQTINLIPQTRGQVFRIATSNSEQISLVKDTVIHNKMNALLSAALQGRKTSEEAEASTENNSTTTASATTTTSTTTTTRVAIARPTLVQNARIVKPVLQIPSNVIRNTPQANLSSTTLEQLREFDMVYKQVKERSSTTPSNEVSATETTPESSPQPQQQRISVTYVNQGQKINCSPVVVVSSYNNIPPAASPALSVASQGSSSPCVTPAPTPTPVLPKVTPKSSKGKSVKNATMHASKASPIPKPQQKPQEDEHTTQRIFDILAEYAEQLRNSPDLNNKPAPRRRSNPPTNPSQNSKRKKSSSSKKSGQCSSSMSTDVDLEDPRTLGSEDSSCGVMQLSVPDEDQPGATASTSESNDSSTAPRQQLILTDSSHNQTRNLIIADSVGEALKMPNTAVLVPGNYIMPVSMVKGGQQIAVVSGGSKILATVPARSGPNMLLFQSFLNQTRKTVPTVKYSTIQPITGISSQSLAGVTAQPPVILPPPSHGISTVTLGQPITVKKMGDDSDRVNTEVLLRISQARESGDSDGTPQPDSSTNALPIKIETVEIEETTATLSDNSSEKGFTYQKSIITTHAPIATPVIAQTACNKEESRDQNQGTQTIMTLSLNTIDRKGDTGKVEEQRVQSVLVTAGTSNGPMLSHSPPQYKQSHYSTTTTTQQNKDDFLRNTQKKSKEKTYQTHSVYSIPVKVKKATTSTPSRADKNLHELCLQRKQAAMERELRLQKSLSEECEDLGVDEPSTSDLFPEADLFFDTNNSPTSYDETSLDLIKRSTSPDVIKRSAMQDQGNKHDETKLTLFGDDDFLFESEKYRTDETDLEYDESRCRSLRNGQSGTSESVSPCEDATLLQTCTSMSDVTLNSPILPDIYQPPTSPPLHKCIHKYTNRKKGLDRKQQSCENWVAEVSSSEDTTCSTELKSNSDCLNKPNDEDLSETNIKVDRLMPKTECTELHCASNADRSSTGRRRNVKNSCDCNGTHDGATSKKRPASRPLSPTAAKKLCMSKKR